MIVVYLIVLILGLSILVCLHEFGHLVVAKICKVYCYEYSIGFGPAIFKHRFRKRTAKKEPLYRALTNGLNKDDLNETTYSLRCIPLGGYVSMAGEDDEPDEINEINIPKERTLDGVNHFKQICIMLAGIAMNFLVAYILFVIAFGCFTLQAYNYATNEISITGTDEQLSENKLYQAGVRSGDKFVYLYQEYVDVYQDGEKKTITYPSESNRYELTSYQDVAPSYEDKVNNNETITLDDLAKTSITYAALNLATQQNIELVTTDEEGTTYDYSDITIDENSKRIIYLTYFSNEEQIEKETTITLNATKEQDEVSFEPFSFNAAIVSYHDTPSEAFVDAGKQFSSYFVNIYRALGSIFTEDGWQNLGGLISIYRVNEQAITSGSGFTFINLWAYISLNLGCFNLIPLPPLDGWNILLALGETVTRKKFSSKFKGIAGTIGTILLIILAVLLIVKDIIMPI